VVGVVVVTMFLFGVILFLRWLSLGVGTAMPTMVHTAVSLLAFVLAGLPLAWTECVGGDRRGEGQGVDRGGRGHGR
jgi:hypothetical protein